MSQTMTVDVSHLTHKPMKRGRGQTWRGSRYYDPASGDLLAKTCSTCRETLPIDSFNKSKSSRGPEPYQARCRECSTASTRVDMRARRESNPDYGSAANKRYRQRLTTRTLEELQTAIDEYYPSGEKYCRDCDSNVKVTEFYPHSYNRDALSRTCKVCHSAKMSKRLVNSYKKHWTANSIPFDQCIYCQMMTDLTPGDLHGDHVIARAIGGPDEMSNIAPACYACNICKGEDTLEKFLAEQFFYEEDRQEILDRLRQYGYVA